ncbi:MAG: CsgG/HfaB family protein [Limnohabitans sp.]
MMGTAAIPLQQDERLIEGPAISEIITPFDRALSCLDGRINREVLRFSVGSILDSTGKEQLSDGGSSKFVTQGAGEIVQSALFRAGVVLVNRRDPRVMESEARWGIRDPKSQIPSTFYVTGSINSLDFLPGGGIDAQIAGIGPRYRQHRMLIGLDLSLTETKTGRILANVPIQKQIIATDEGFNVGRFFGNTLVSVDLGHNKREAVHFALRQMLNLATFELLTQMMPPDQYSDCYEMIESVEGVLGESRSGKRVAQYRQSLKGKANLAATKSAPAQQNSAAVLATPVVPTAEESAAGAKTAGATDAAPPSNGTAVTGNGANQAAAYFKNEAATTPQSAMNALELLRSTPSREAMPEASTEPLVTAPGTASNALPEANTAAKSEANSTENTAAKSAAKVTENSTANGASLKPSASAVLAVPAPVMQAAQQGKLPAQWPSYCQVTDGQRWPSVTPLRSQAAGSKVQLQSAQATEVCAVDALGKSWWLKLQPGISQTLIGKAPWRLVSEAPLKPLSIEFQGGRLRVPSYVINRMELHERH